MDGSGSLSKAEVGTYLCRKDAGHGTSTLCVHVGEVFLGSWQGFGE